MLKLCNVQNPNIIYFENDDEFYKFAVVPELIVKKGYVEHLGKEVFYTDFDFTNNYIDAVNSGKSFVIKDPDSKVYKHKSVSFRTECKPVSNLKKYECKQ
jgi:hypothetical protein